MLVGYVRISKNEQNMFLQKDALYRVGCQKLFGEILSGLKKDKPKLNEALQYLKSGDTLIVWRLDRISRSLKELLEIVTALELKGVNFKSLQECIDTSTSTGKFMFHIFGALAEFESNIIRERTKAGLAAARERGRKGGRPKILNKDQQKFVSKLYQNKKYTVEQLCEIMGISRPTLYKYIALKKNPKFLGRKKPMKI